MPLSDISIPILPSRSLEATLAFYRKLGFTGDIHPHGGYVILTRGTVELHFIPHPALRPETSCAACYLRVSDVAALHRAFSALALPAAGIPRIDALQDKPWGLREFAIVDPDGNLLRIGQVLPH